MNGRRSIVILAARTARVITLLAPSLGKVALQLVESEATRSASVIERDDELKNRERMPITAIKMHDQRHPNGRARKRYDTALSHCVARLAVGSRSPRDDTLEGRLHDTRVPDTPAPTPTALS